MYLKQGDLFWGMSKDVVSEAMDNTVKMSLNEGELLFSNGDPAENFYILLTGRIQLSIGESGPVVYVARHPGEVVGWSSIIGRASFSAKAVCVAPATVVKVDTADFIKLAEKNPENGQILYRRVAEMLGNRLVDLYPSIA